MRSESAETNNSSAHTYPTVDSTTSLVTPSCQSNVADVSRIVSTLQTSFAASHKHEQCVRRRLADQVSQTNELAVRLQKEQARNARLCGTIQLNGCEDATSSASETSERQTSGVPPGAYHDLRDSFNAMSPMLIQYRYDELKCSYRRCQKSLHKKNRRLKEVSREHCMVVDKMEEVLHKYKEAQQRLEHVCCMYIDMFNKKEEEIFLLRRELEYECSQ